MPRQHPPQPDSRAALLLLVVATVLALVVAGLPLAPRPGGGAANAAAVATSGLVLGPTATASAGGLVLAPTPAATAGGLVLGPTPTPTRPGGVSGRHYTSPTYGFTLAWPTAWSVTAFSSKGGVDTLTLTDRTSTVGFTTTTGFNGDVARCRTALVAALRADPKNRGVMPGPGPNGKPLQGSDATRAWAVYLYGHTGNNGQAAQLVRYLECRVLVPGRAMLEIVDDVPVDAFNAEAPKLQTLLGALTIPVAAATPAAQTVPATAPATPAAPVGTPGAASPTANACAGVAAWVAATVPRITRTAAIGSELATAGTGSALASKLTGYAAEFSQMATAQRSLPVPAAAAAINAQLVDVFERYSNGLTALVVAATAGDQNGVAQAVTGLQQTDAAFQQAVTAGTALATRCGVPA